MMMNSKAPLLVSFFLVLFCSSSANGFNITKLLDRFPDFSNFNQYLTQTKLADEINKRQTITVLAVENSEAGSLSGKSPDDLKKVMSLHVVLDYYDVPKLKKMSKKTTLLTTLLQSSGVAVGQQGFLNVTNLSSGETAFGSAVKGSPLNANLIKSVAAQPYNISVLQISSVIIPGGMAGAANNSTSSAPQHSPVPAASPKKSKTPSKSTPPASTPAEEPASSDDVESPSEAPTPAADTPAGSPPEVAADSPASGGDKAADAPNSASAGITLSLASRVVIALFSTLSLVSMF